MNFGVGTSVSALSDFGYGSGIGSSRSSLAQSSWGSQELEMEQARQNRLSSSFLDLVIGRSGRCSIDEEFRMNGFDSPYNPRDDAWTRKPDGLTGAASSNVYLRQQSWPAPTPSVPLPSSTQWKSTSSSLPEPLHTSTPIPFDPKDQLTEEQRRVLSSLPGEVVLALLRTLERGRQPQLRRRQAPPSFNEYQECRFCKNNGERESYYRSHALRDRCGRVTCPVLRAYVCNRCGARGENAHTAKYCPLASADERKMATAMRRSMAAGRRRQALVGSTYDVTFGETPLDVVQDHAILDSPLDPLWAELEAKLML